MLARTLRLTALVTLLPITGCVRYGNLHGGPGSTLSSDAQHLASGDLAAPGPDPIMAFGTDVHGLRIVVYRPERIHGRAPGIVFLPGLMAPEAQYESYGRALASHGFVVAVRGGYGPFIADATLAHDAGEIAAWLIATDLVDPARIGVAGHSKGAKDAVWAAADDPRFAAVVALEPDDQGNVSVIHDALPHLHVPMLLIGAELAWRGWSICSPREHNYERFYERSPAGTVELVLRNADHVQVMDNPEFPGQQICRTGTADSASVRILARRAMVGFFEQHLAGAPASDWRLGDAGLVRVRDAATGLRAAR